MSVSLNQINNFLLEKQYLLKNTKKNDINKVIDDICGLHATVPTTPYLSLVSRLKNFSKQELDNEMYVKRNLGKIRFVRKTVYVLPKKLIPFAFNATKEIIASNSKPHLFKYLGVSEEEYQSSSKKIIEILRTRAITTKEIKKEIDKSINISGIVNLMCDQGLVIRGKPSKGWKSNIHTYHLFSDYFSDVDLDTVDENQAKSSVVKIYIETYGPVTENDIAWWTGFKKGIVKKILDDLEKEITKIEINGLNQEYLILESNKKILELFKKPKDPVINLLPKLDNFIMGYKNRDRYLNNDFYKYVFDRSGNATNTILLDGEIIGVWDFIEPNVKLFLFKQIKPKLLDSIYSEAEKIGNFIFEKPVKVQEVDNMIPLIKRTAGGFLSPLKNS